MRVAGFNAQSFRTGLTAAAAALSEAAGDEPVDLVLLQECGPRRVTLRFADLLGMEALSTHRPFNRVRNAVLFRSPWQPGSSASVANLSRQGRMLRRGYIAEPLKA